MGPTRQHPSRRAADIEKIRKDMMALPVDEATPDEIDAFKRGGEEIARGEYVSLDELLRVLEEDRRQERAERSRRYTGKG